MIKVVFRKIFLAAFAVLLTVFLSCDMVYITDENEDESSSGGGREISDHERDHLEKTGRFIKLTNMPLNTQVQNIFSAQVANSASVIGKLNTNNEFFIYRNTSENSAIVYLPLVYNDNSEFMETGFFYTAFSIHVDAITTYIIEIPDKFLVHYINGRGTLDIRTLPVSGSIDANLISGKEKDELEKTGRFIKFTYMPLNTQSSNIISVQISNSVSVIGKYNKNNKISVFRENDLNTVYVPLVYNDDTEFVENGAFFIAMTIHIDAFTKYVINVSDNVIVLFTEGRSTLDIRTLPRQEPPSSDMRFLTVFNMPPNITAQNVSNVAVHNKFGPVAECADYSLVEVFTSGGKSTVIIPIVFYGSNSAFSCTGSFYVSFEIFVDALIHYSVSPSDNLIVSFIDGNGYLDIDDLPSVSQNYRYLTIYNLPSNLSAYNISNVFVHNQAGVIAYCSDYSLVDIFHVDDDGNSVAQVPLFYQKINTVFIETGSYFISFDINVDASTRYLVTKDDQIHVSFINGNGYLNIEDTLSSYRYLTIYNLPPNLSVRNISSVLVHNQIEVVAYCSDYSLIDFFQVDDGKSVVRIPLFYQNLNTSFAETGSYFVSFDINVDASARYLVAKDDQINVSFISGDGSLDINNIIKPSASVSTIIIKGLPYHTTKSHFSNIGVFNLVSQVARCPDNNSIVISKEGEYAAAEIPLYAVNGKEYFQGNGKFLFTFTVNVDIENQISYNNDDKLSLVFNNGSSFLDLSLSIGSFNGFLVNPADTAAPRIKAGTSFDIDGFIYTVPVETAINSVLPSLTSVVYIYASRVNNSSVVVFEYSTVAPVYVKGKEGYYNGDKRALWKMLYLIDNNIHFLFKTYVADNFPQFGNYITSNSLNTSSFKSAYSLSGTANPSNRTVTLDSGIYLVRLTGAGGGGGYGFFNNGTVSGSSAGGQGGIITEILTLNAAAAFTVFTGSGGTAASASAINGNFDFRSVALLRYKIFGGVADNALVLMSHLITEPQSYKILEAGINYGSISGGSGGGGGSGSFIYSDKGYLLAAAGGGGGSGGSFLTPGGAGGAGGSIGSGAGGGSAGYLSQSSPEFLYNNHQNISVIINIPRSNFTSSGGYGGKGGGYNGGAGGTGSDLNPNRNGNNGSVQIFPESINFPESFSFNGSNSSSYTLGSIDPNIFITEWEIPNQYALYTPTVSGSPLHYTVPFDAFGASKVLSRKIDASAGGSGGATAFISSINLANGIGANAPVLKPFFYTQCDIGYDLMDFNNNFNYLISIFVDDFVNNNKVKNFKTYYPTINGYYSLGTGSNGLSGGSGGNNRNSTRGGGAQGGSVVSNIPTDGAAGSVVIYKIY